MSHGLTTAGLPSICSFVTDGTHDSPKLQAAGIPFIKGKHISSGRIDFENCDFIAEEDHAKCIKRVKPQVDDVLFANIGSVGDVARVTEEREFSIKNLALFRPDPEKVDPTYFYYLVVSPVFRGVFLNTRSGAAQPFISLEAFRSHCFPFNPEKYQQRKIGVILTAYDDLIENNRRRMELLEDAARQLYREWFVRLRFPGYEHTRIINGVPEGWQLRELIECVVFRSGGTPSKTRSEYWDGTIPWVSSGEMRETRIYDTPHHLSSEGAQAGSRLVPPGTILIVVRGMSLAKEFRLATVAREMAFNQDLKELDCKDGIAPSYLFYSLLDRRDTIRELATEASHGTKKLDTAVLERLPILVPDQLRQQLFVDAVVLLVAQRDTLHNQIAQLRAARDLLLPRLMSGEIAV